MNYVHKCGKCFFFFHYSKMMEGLGRWGGPLALQAWAVTFSHLHADMLLGVVGDFACRVKYTLVVALVMLLGVVGGSEKMKSVAGLCVAADVEGLTAQINDFWLHPPRLLSSEGVETEIIAAGQGAFGSPWG